MNVCHNDGTVPYSSFTYRNAATIYFPVSLQGCRSRRHRQGPRTHDGGELVAAHAIKVQKID